MACRLLGSHHLVEFDLAIVAVPYTDPAAHMGSERMRKSPADHTACLDNPSERDASHQSSATADVGVLDSIH